MASPRNHPGHNQHLETGYATVTHVASVTEVILTGTPVPRMELPGWRDRFGVVAGITTRGTEAEPFDLGLASHQPIGTVLGQWAAFRTAEPGFPMVTLGRQVHGTEVVWHEGGRGWLLLDGVDGHATDAGGILLTVTVADCTPVYLFDPATGAIALLHAGWRGASGRILERGIRLLQGRVGTLPKDIVMHCGVAICGPCYEVGSEVFDAFGLPIPAGRKGPLDVRAQLVRQGEELGLGEISVSTHCSGHDQGLFHSHRRSLGADGRMIAYIGRPLATP
jgi:YfiH family protein